MKLKTIKTSTLILLIVFSCTLLAGCSNEEISLFNLSKATTNLCLKPMEQSGEITLKINNLHSLLAESNIDPIQQAALEKILGVVSLKYSIKGDISNDVMEYNIFFKSGVSSDYSELVKFIIVDNALYIKLDKLCEFLRSTNNPDLTAFLDKGIKDAEYLIITPQSYLNSLGLTTYNTKYTTLNSMFTPSEQIKTSQLTLEFMDGLINEVYTNYNTGLVTKNGNKYTFTLDVSQLVPFLKGFTNYTLDNFDKFASFTSSFISDLNEEELSLFNLPPEIKTNIINGLDSMIPMVALNKEKYKVMAAEVFDNANNEIINVLAGSTFASSIEEINSTEYRSDFNLGLNIKTDSNPISFSMQGNDNSKACQDFTLSAPSGKMLTLEELQARINRVMKINVTSGSWELKEDQFYLQGNSTVKFIDGFTYLPLRQIAETLGEEVYWDTDKSMSYVIKNDQRIYMTGVIIDGKIYVKTRDFTYLGYKVNWDSINGIITLTKSVF